MSRPRRSRQPAATDINVARVTNQSDSDTTRLSEQSYLDYQHTLQPYSAVIMAIHHSILLGMRPPLALLAFWVWFGMVWSVLNAASGSILTSFLWLYFVWCTVEYAARRNLLPRRKTVFAWLTDKCRVNDEMVLQNTGRRPLTFNELCQLLAWIHLQLASVRLRSKFVWRHYPLAYLLLVFIVYSLVSLANQYLISERTMLYGLALWPFFLPALYHYGFMPLLGSAQAQQATARTADLSQRLASEVAVNIVSATNWLASAALRYAGGNVTTANTVTNTTGPANDDAADLPRRRSFTSQILHDLGFNVAVSPTNTGGETNGTRSVSGASITANLLGNWWFQSISPSSSNRNEPFSAADYADSLPADKRFSLIEESNLTDQQQSTAALKRQPESVAFDDSLLRYRHRNDFHTEIRQRTYSNKSNNSSSSSSSSSNSSNNCKNSDGEDSNGFVKIEAQ